jgi:hypothetical protein
MGNAQAAAELRKAGEQPEGEVQLATLAIELGMIPEVEALYLMLGDSTFSPVSIEAVAIGRRPLIFAKNMAEST